jgi:serine/threonine-protein kinase
MAAQRKSPLAGPDEVRAGSRLGRYQVLLPIAQGGMARVWAAKQHGQRGFSKLVAIKTILPELARDPKFESMFLDEARLAARVHHPNVCEIFDLGEEHSTLYLAMEWVNGESLSRVLKPPVPKGQQATAHRMNARIAARILADSAKGLHAAHQLCDDAGQPLNVVHRDVSPQNIMISVDGNVKVTDFGVAKALGTTQESTSAGQLKGKIAYMAPEQAKGGVIDRRTDVFALGIVLYEVTTGMRPFRGEGELEVLRTIAAGIFEPPSSVVPGYPRELEQIVLTAMAPEPDDRYPTADAMRVALEEWLTRSGSLVTEALVAGAMHERVGPIVTQRAARIRERMNSESAQTHSELHSEPPLTPPPPSERSASHVSHAGTSQPSSGGHSHSSSPSNLSHPSSISYVAPMVATSPPPMMTTPTRGAQTTRNALWGVALGLGVFGLIAVVGGGGYYMISVKGRRAEPTQPDVVPVGGAAAAAPAPVSAAPGGKPAAPSSASLIQIEFVEPKTGVTLMLDGQPVKGAKPTIARPKPGGVKLLVVTAEGYKQDTLRIDENTPDQLDLMLVKIQARTEQKPAQPAKESKESKEGPKPLKVDIPDNPF